jgi:hypothetical protein
MELLAGPSPSAFDGVREQPAVRQLCAALSRRLDEVRDGPERLPVMVAGRHLHVETACLAVHDVGVRQDPTWQTVVLFG